MNESEETEVKTFPLYPNLLQWHRSCLTVSQYLVDAPVTQKPTELDLHSLQEQGIFWFSRTKVKVNGYLVTLGKEYPSKQAPITDSDQPDGPSVNSSISSSGKKQLFWSDC